MSTSQQDRLWEAVAEALGKIDPEFLEQFGFIGGVHGEKEQEAHKADLEKAILDALAVNAAPDFVHEASFREMLSGTAGGYGGDASGKPGTMEWRGDGGDGSAA